MEPFLPDDGNSLFSFFRLFFTYDWSVSFNEMKTNNLVFCVLLASVAFGETYIRFYQGHEGTKVIGTPIKTIQPIPIFDCQVNKNRPAIL
jgi:hypothetical protein